MNNFRIDFWTIWGFASQGFFFSRFILQWYQSGKLGKITIPHSFWTLSLIGSVMLFIYALARKDIVFLAAGIFQLIIFSNTSIPIKARSLWPKQCQAPRL